MLTTAGTACKTWDLCTESSQRRADQGGALLPLEQGGGRSYFWSQPAHWDHSTQSCQLVSRAYKRMCLRPPWVGALLRKAQLIVTCQTCQTVPPAPPQTSLEPASWSLFAQLGWGQRMGGVGLPSGS